MKQAQTIVWNPYPECKEYLETLDEDTTILISWQTDKGLVISRHHLWELKNCPEKHVKAVSLYPAPFDPEATEFNFETAKLLMEEDENIICICNQRKYRIRTYDINNQKDRELQIWSINNDCWMHSSVGYAEINGKWRLA